jgi:hypothetical protein
MAIKALLMHFISSANTSASVFLACPSQTKHPMPEVHSPRHWENKCRWMRRDVDVVEQPGESPVLISGNQHRLVVKISLFHHSIVSKLPREYHTLFSYK